MYLTLRSDEVFLFVPGPLCRHVSCILDIIHMRRYCLNGWKIKVDAFFVSPHTSQSFLRSISARLACTYSGAAVLGSFDVVELYNIGVLPSDVRAPNTGRACL